MSWKDKPLPILIKCLLVPFILLATALFLLFEIPVSTIELFFDKIQEIFK